MSQTKAQLISDLVQALNFTGTSSAPANGMYLSAANTIKLATNSNPRLTIDSSGNAVFTGTCTATTFIGALTGTASNNAVLTGSTNNTITTVTGANAITGEANLTFNGSGDLTVMGNEGISANLYLIADEGDDNGDGWRVGSNQDANDLTFANNLNSNYLDKFTLTSTGNATFAGTCTATTFIGALTGNASGSAATVTGAAQTAITSVGTLTSLQITNHLGLGVAATEFGSGVKTIVLQGASSTKSGCINFKEYSSGAALANIFAQNDTTYGLSIGTRCSGEDGDFIRFHTGALGTTRMYIKSDGKVGIGTTAPAGKLTVHNTDDANVNVFEVYNDNGNMSGSFSQSSTGDGTVGVRKNDGTLSVFFRSNGISYLDGGDVGIGNTSPSCRLAIKDVAEHTAYASVTPSVTDCMLQLYNNPPNESANDHATIQFGINGGSHNRVNTISAVAESAGNRKLAFTFCTDEAGSRGEKMRITGDGNVGIGVTGPYSPLHVKGIDTTIGVHTYPQLTLETEATDGAADKGTGIMFLNHDGNGGKFGGGIRVLKESATVLNHASYMSFTTRPGGGSVTERLRIGSYGETKVYADKGGDYAFWAQNDGANTNRYGILIQCGADDAAGTNYALGVADGNATTQGYLTFTGGTLSLVAFTASHPCIIPDADNPSDNSMAYPYGTLLETISIQYSKNKKDGSDTERGIRYKVQKTQSANSRKVLGAYAGSMNGGPEGQTNEHDAYVLGDGHILVNNAGGNIEVGDGICSSAIAGIGQKATANPSMIIGIAQEAITFTGSETKLVAVQYGLQQFTPWS